MVPSACNEVTVEDSYEGFPVVEVMHPSDQVSVYRVSTVSKVSDQEGAASRSRNPRRYLNDDRSPLGLQEYGVRGPRDSNVITTINNHTIGYL